MVWSAQYTAFGNAEILVETVVNNLRFPGQYYDAETGLHYNWNRYYDSKSGRYLQIDPLGFAGGDINCYGYVGNNPLNGVDPWGLERKCIVKSILVTAYCATGPGADWSYYKPKSKEEKPGNVGPGTVAVANTEPKPYPFGADVTVYDITGVTSDETLVFTPDYIGKVHDTGAGWDSKHHHVSSARWIDIWLSCKEAREWGKQWRLVKVCYDENVCAE